jgi:hypothetical protein
MKYFKYKSSQLEYGTLTLDDGNFGGVNQISYEKET